MKSNARSGLSKKHKNDYSNHKTDPIRARRFVTHEGEYTYLKPSTVKK